MDMKLRTPDERVVGPGNPLPVGGGAVQAVPDFQTAADLLAAYSNFAGVAPSDFVTKKNTSNGQAITALVGSPLSVGTDSRVVLNVPITQPGALEVEASMVRARHQFATMTLFADDDTGADAVPAPINIVTVYQSNSDFGAAYSAVAGTILTIVLETALPKDGENGAVFLYDWVHVDGLVDNRLNYPNLAIKYISADRKTITAGFSDESALPSIAATYSPALGTCKLYMYNNMAGAHDGAGFRFTGTNAAQAALVSIFGGGDVQISGTLIGDHRVAVASSAPIVTAGATTGNGELRATSRYRIECRPNDVSFMGKVSDANVGWSHYATRTAVKPAHQRGLRPRFRLVTAPSATRPVAKIISIVKTGTTTWTVTHDGAYTFQTGQYVTTKGNRDVVNFPNITTPTQITVINSTSFTLVSTTGTATGYGGSVILANGGVDQSGIIGQNVQSATLDATTGWLTLVGNPNWSGVAFGDYVEIHGGRIDLTGADLGIDGCWEVANVWTTALTLMPVFNIAAQRVSPAPSAFASTNCGGSVIIRTTLRAHDMILESYNESRVVIDGAGTSRLDKAIPINAVGGSLSISGTAAVSMATNTPTIAAGTAAIGTVSPSVPPTAFFVNSAASTNGALIITGTSGLQSIYGTNTGAGAAYVKLYNKATAPTVGTDVPEMVIPIPAAVGGVPGIMTPLECGFIGHRFPLGLGIAITGGAADADTTPVAAGQVKVKLSRTI